MNGREQLNELSRSGKMNSYGSKKPVRSVPIQLNVTVCKNGPSSVSHLSTAQCW